MIRLAPLALALAACGGGRARYVPLHEGPEGDADADVDAELDADGDADAGLEPDGEADVDDDGEADADGEPQLPTRGLVLVLHEVDGAGGLVESSASVRFRFRRPMTWCGYRFGFYGDCTTFAANQPSCDPACDEGQVCEWNGDCSAAACRPARHPAELFDAGEVSIDGASHQPEITCALSAEGGSYGCDVDAAADLWEGGDPIRASAPGLTFPAFAAEVTAPERLEVTTDTSAWSAATFDGTTGVTLEWNVETPAMAIEISLETATTSLSCLSSDSGSYTIPAEAIAALGSLEGLTVTALRSNAGIDNEARDGETKLYAETVGLSWTVPE